MDHVDPFGRVVTAVFGSAAFPHDHQADLVGGLVVVADETIGNVVDVRDVDRAGLHLIGAVAPIPDVLVNVGRHGVVDDEEFESVANLGLVAGYGKIRQDIPAIVVDT